MISTSKQQGIALLAFMATGATFAEGKSSFKNALTVNKKKRVRGEVRPISHAKQPLNLKHTPVTLSKAHNSQDAEQAWRTVRSYFGMEIFLEFDIGTPG